ncbi:hypothetical protein [Roseiconus lacunae]|uniref:Uncharacterized protein n=1 Tax=Roseiconus lacunae TaxID=2605694 RepID=A0ABT7PK01_9BACT|nr:hypothetical protein [Roseiconus lacunae]MCD0459379.1 hypothetical protein [Roseiconus lacunae]MDM4016836.1 hypothetical protein [Roseiconus lacunae]WRQ50852.1 hypothetical protein U8335_28390 [Stieleria sp. HD01]
MWRAFFIALGIMAIIIGFESLIIESADFYSNRGSSPKGLLDPSSIPGQTTTTWKPKEWFPWLVLSVGSLIVIYSFTLPKRFQTAG